MARVITRIPAQNLTKGDRLADGGTVRRVTTGWPLGGVFVQTGHGENDGQAFKVGELVRVECVEDQRDIERSIRGGLRHDLRASGLL